MTGGGTTILEKLFAAQDLKYRDFQAKLIPTVSKETIIGVRTPVLRRLAKEYFDRADSGQFLNFLPHKYFEENNLHGFLIEQIADYDRCMARLEEFLPFVDNWATCDQVHPKVFTRHPPGLMEHIDCWLKSDRTYTVRFGIGILMKDYLDDFFAPAYLDKVAAIHSTEYYVNMMAAWYFAVALAKQPQAAFPYIEEQRLDRWVHNKAIQKAVESFRIGDAEKKALKMLRRP